MSTKIVQRRRHPNVVFITCIVIVTLAVAWFYIRDDVYLRRYGYGAHEAYVAFYRTEPVYYRLGSLGSKKLANILLEETKPRRLPPTYSEGILATVVFFGSDGAPTLTLSLPKPKGMRLKDAWDYWNRRIKEIETAMQVTSEEAADKTDAVGVFYIRRRSR